MSQRAVGEGGQKQSVVDASEPLMYCAYVGSGADSDMGMYEQNQVLADMANDEVEEEAGTSTLGLDSDYLGMGVLKPGMVAMHNLDLDLDIGIDVDLV
jgi:hypothetical protein